MHDPMTVAFEIRYPWVSRRNRKSTDKFLRTYRDPIITVWHVDPETDGTDDSCDWFWWKFSAREQAKLDDLVTNPDDNITYWFKGSWAEHDEYEMRRFVSIVAAHYRRSLTRRPFWHHPRHHFWHYRLQVHPWQQLRRHLFDRCAACGKSFARGQSVFADSWDSLRPRHPWFRSTPGIYHRECYPMGTPVAADEGTSQA